jgi:hypothetical protein
MTSSCVGWDWGIVVILTLLVAAVFLFYCEFVLEKPIQVFAALLLLVYAADYLYLTYLVGYFTTSALGWVLAFLIVGLIYILAYFVNNAWFGTMVVILMLTDGHVWWIAGLASFFGGGFVALVVWYFSGKRQIKDLGDLIVYSLVLSTCLAAGIVGIFANSRDDNAPDACESKHINILFVCDDLCGTVVTNNGISAPYQAWVAMLIVPALLRIAIILVVRGCNSPPARTDAEKRDRKKMGTMCWIVCCCPQNGYSKAKMTAALERVPNAVPEEPPDPHAPFVIEDEEKAAAAADIELAEPVVQEEDAQV